MDGDIEQMNQLNISVLELLLTLYDETTKTFDVRAFSTGFFNIARNKNENSLIRKQMLKQTYVNFMDISYMSMVLEKGLEYIIRENRLSILFYKGRFNTIIKLLINIKQGNIPDLESYIKSLQLCAFIMTSINCIWMDFYFILRSFKTPDTFHHQASLCLGFFGNDVKSICYLLTDIMDLYEFRMVSTADSIQERCTVMNEPIDLVKDLCLHNQSRNEPNKLDLETEKYNGILVNFYERSPSRKSSLRKKRKSKRKHRKSSDDFFCEAPYAL